MSETRTEPQNGFASFEFDPRLERAIADAGFAEPRPIQKQTIPAALDGQDVLGLAQTGTGKTAAFALPLLDYVLESRERQPSALIVAPTRELATQIAEEIRRLAKYTRIQVATLFGGVSLGSQRTALRRNPEILVACPGRLLDLYRQGDVRLDRIETLVLDEADHMFDMGFLPDIRKILEALPEDRQNLLFSATMPPEIRKLAKGLLYKPHVVELESTRPVSTIDHALYPVDPGRKMQLLEKVLGDGDCTSAIVFTRTKHRAKRLAQQLSRSGHRAVALQGNMSQNARTRAMDGFRKKEFDVLVATDIAARGIDIEQVSHVVNFDMPTTPEGYTHRIGRTGRAERQGRAYTFVSGEDREMIRAVERRIGAMIPRLSVEGITGELPADREQPRRRPSDRPASSRPRRRRRRPAGSRPRSQSGNASKPGRSAGGSRSKASGTAAGGSRKSGNAKNNGRRRRRAAS
ncbi:hypothetical protein ABI59_08395 [Acidobacteria bacterium Mor1]|nr:hypothetical protein ABI59_08395 [Acidobacteria bacterium Mor1]